MNKLDNCFITIAITITVTMTMTMTITITMIMFDLLYSFFVAFEKPQ